MRRKKPLNASQTLRMSLDYLSLSLHTHTNTHTQTYTEHHNALVCTSKCVQSGQSVSSGGLTGAKGGRVSHFHSLKSLSWQITLCLSVSTCVSVFKTAHVHESV